MTDHPPVVPLALVASSISLITVMNLEFSKIFDFLSTCSGEGGGGIFFSFFLTLSKFELECRAGEIPCNV